MYTINFFDDTLALIKNDDLRGVVRSALEEAPAYFWDAPAPMTGKYHPPDSNGPGGLCRHTKKVVWFAVCFARAYSHKLGKSNLNDTLVAAAHLHDICKYGEGDRRGSYNDYKRHGLLAYMKFFNVGFQKQLPEGLGPVWTEVCHAIRWHMGQWAYLGPGCNTTEIKDMPLPTQLLHLADMAASEKHFTGF